MNVPCPTHGSRRAHRGCHFCRRPICRLCEVKMRGHIYCSTRCARDAGHAAWRRWLRRGSRRPVPSAAAVVLVLLIAGAPTLAALRAVAELDRLNAPTVVFGPSASAASARIETVTSAPEGNRDRGKGVRGNGGLSLRGRAIRQRRIFRSRPLSASRTFARPGPIGSARSSSPRRAPSLLPRRPRPPLLRRRPQSSLHPSQQPAATATGDGGGGSRLFPRTGGSSRHRRLVRRRILGSGSPRNPECSPRAWHPHDDLLDRTVHPAIPGPRPARRARRSRSRQSHRHAPPSHDVRAGRPSGDAPATSTAPFSTGELERTARLYREATGREMAHLWRAPYGEQNGQLRRLGARGRLLARRLDRRPRRTGRPRLGLGPGVAALPERAGGREPPHRERGKRRCHPASPRKRPQRPRRSAHPGASGRSHRPRLPAGPGVGDAGSRRHDPRAARRPAEGRGALNEASAPAAGSPIEALRPLSRSAPTAGEASSRTAARSIGSARLAGSLRGGVSDASRRRPPPRGRGI